MSPTPPTYDAKEKVWSGPAFDRRRINVPFGEVLLNELARNGDKLIQINHDTDETMTCTEMRLKSLKVAENLEKIGIQQGDHISIVAHSTNDVAPFLIGAIAYGAVVSPIYSASVASEINHMFKMIKPKLIVCDGKEIEKVLKSLEDIPIEPMIYSFSNSNDQIRSTDAFFKGYDTEPSTFQLPQILDLEKTITFMVPSSGSTGVPKCVLISHAMILSWIYSNLTGTVDGDIQFYVVRPIGMMAVRDIATSILFRAPRIITDQQLTTELTLDVFRKREVNMAFLVPFRVAAIAKHLATNYDLPKLKTIVSAGNSLSETTRINLRKVLPNVNLFVNYGMSEVGVISFPNANAKPGSTGFLLSGMTAKVVDDGGNSLGPGEIGELLLNRNCPFMGYLNNEEATKDSIVDGWLLTGDMVYFDNDGELFITERKKNILKYKGNQVVPSLIEDFIKEQFNVEHVIVVGIPGENDLGHLPAAVIVQPPNSSVTEADISKAIEDNFVYHNHLCGGVYFVKSLPRGGLDKVQRKKVEQIAAELYAAKRL